MLATNSSFSFIAKTLSVSVSTISREIKRNSWPKKYRPKEAEEVAQIVRDLWFPYRHYVKTITTDNGSEFCDHRKISQALGATVYFADPYSSWQKGCIENTNKLIRQYIPKGIDFDILTDE